MGKRRYTAEGNDAVEARIEADQALVAAAVQQLFADQFRALVLIGGYARGEGGFEEAVTGPQAYNDYDYFVIYSDEIKSRLPEVSSKLASVARALEIETGVEVDFFPLTVSQLSRLPFTLMYAEMQAGHQVIAGDPDLLKIMPSMPLDRVPDSEFVRLMLNRGSLLLLNRQTMLSANAWDGDQFAKYINKASLSIGDDLLQEHQLYDISYRTKLEHLKCLDNCEARALLPHYERAVIHKFNPKSVEYPQSELEYLQQQVIQLWLTRFRRSIQRLYAAESSVGLTAKVKRLAYNFAVNVRDFGLGEVLRDPELAFHYPRDWLYQVLPMLLSGDMEADQSRVKRLLKVDTATEPALIEAYLKLWHRYS